MDRVGEREEGGGLLAVRRTGRVDGSGVGVPLSLPSGRAGEEPAAVVRSSDGGNGKDPVLRSASPPRSVEERGRFFSLRSTHHNLFDGSRFCRVPGTDSVPQS
eukprot:scaffold1187_cov363-Pavlova_lutheri.AAC.1